MSLLTGYSLCVVRFNSDGTLNPNGVRFGSAEIYNIGMYISIFHVAGSSNNEI